MASSMDCRSHSAVDHWRSSMDEAVNAVQNVAAASFFLLCLMIEKKDKKG